MAVKVTFTVVIYRDSSFFNELKLLGETLLMILCLFFNEHELCAKTARSCVYFLTSMNYVLKLLDYPVI